MSAGKEARSPDDHLDDGDLQQRVRERARELLDEGKATARDLGARIRGPMRERPLTALVVAGSIGLLVGMLLGRKR
jgi:ElaB/YqjD/DUF883 family membrane-anchored ribosome-binding protein